VAGEDRAAAEHRTVRLVDRVFSEAVAHGERAVSVCRAAFCLAIGIRYVLMGPLTFPGGVKEALVEFPALGIAIVFSVWILARVRRRGVTRGILYASVSLDAVICFSSLLVNVLWPPAGYRGIATIPDTAAMLVITFAAGFRLYPLVAAVGGAFNITLGSVLVVVDKLLNPELARYSWPEVMLGGIYLLGAAALAVLVATRTRRLVQASASQAVAAERARRSLGLVLQDHHDVRSLLSSASLNAELVLRELAQQDESRAFLTAREVKQDLELINEAVGVVRQRAYSELATLEDPEAVELGPILEQVSGAVARRFPDTSIEVESVPGMQRVSVAGGSRGMERVLLNLLVNACEGQGDAAAGRVEVDVESAPDSLVITVSDDGAGFSDAQLAAPENGGWSTKPGGSGLGLALVKEIVSASGGQLQLGNRSRGGAEVRVTVPRA
jgi:signal transduction histidine kinase